MSAPLFIGRDAELSLWDELLNSPDGHAVVVLGDAGMGKTRLLDRMVEWAIRHKNLRCAALRYAVSPDESPGMVLKVVMEDAFLAARARIGQLETRGKRFHQWDVLFERFHMVDHETVDRYDFLNALRYDTKKHIFDQFLQRLSLFSRRIGEQSRLILVIDPRQDRKSVV